LVVSGYLANHSLNIAETAGALRVGVRAIVQSLGALGLDVRRDAGRSGIPDFLLNRSHRVLEAITDQPLRVRALLENRVPHFRTGEDVAGCGMKMRRVAGRRRAEAESIQRV
jgi:hypothetical protein